MNKKKERNGLIKKVGQKRKKKKGNGKTNKWGRKIKTEREVMGQHSILREKKK